MAESLDRHPWMALRDVRSYWGAWLTVWVIRVILAMLFIPTGLTKLLGVPFQRGLEPWVLPFFDALYDAGLYWRFLGLGQLTAAVLLLIPRLKTLGAIIYLPISLNLVVITISLGFRWTAVFATSAMLCGNLILLLWDAERLRSILRRGEPAPLVPWRFVLRWSAGAIAIVVLAHVAMILA